MSIITLGNELKNRLNGPYQAPPLPSNDLELRPAAQPSNQAKMAMDSFRTGRELLAKGNLALAERHFQIVEMLAEDQPILMRKLDLTRRRHGLPFVLVN